MKTCPNCKMTTDSHSECAVCGHSLVDIEYSEREGEKYVLNKYFLPFLWKHYRVPLICLIIVLILAAFCVSNELLYSLYSIALVVGAILLSLYRRRWISLLTWKYNENYLEPRFPYAVHYISGLAVFMQAMTLFLSLIERIN